MLEEIRIRCLGVIDDAVLELTEGLNVLTGETGAGKTMILTALNLVLGGKADSALVRSGAERAMVTARIQLEQGHPARQIALDVGAEIEEESAIFSRTITDQGRTRALISGSPVNASTLTEMSSELIAIHAQSANIRLLRSNAQREILDKFGGADLSPYFLHYQVAFRELRESEESLVRLRDLGALADKEVSELEALVEELRRVGPSSGELDRITEEIDRLQFVDELREAAHLAHEVVAGGEQDELGALNLLATAMKALERVRDKGHEPKEFYQRLSDPIFLLGELATDLAAYESSLDADPVRLEWLQERKASLISLLRRFGRPAETESDPLTALIERAKDAEMKLQSRENLSSEIEIAERALKERRQLLAEAAIDLSKVRAKYAALIATLVTEKIRELAMPNAEFTISMQTRSSDVGLTIDGKTIAYSSSGVDDVEMLLTAHAGGAPVPLAKGASGGELSRVMLAIEVVLASNSAIGTFIFDEVDAGVGGKAAIEVGRQLAELAKTAQVVVVTHLAQVAAFADSHYTVTKSESGLVSQSNIRRLSDEERVIELARMLAGQEQSANAQRHAIELLELARVPK